MSILQARERVRRRHGVATVRERGSRHVIPAPVMGWNTRDPLAEMKPEYGVTLDNYFPELGRVRLRQGSREHSAGVGTGDVETLFVHRSGSVSKLMAAGGGEVYDVSTNTAASVVSGQSGNRWDVANFGGVSILVNGTDAPVRINADGASTTAHGWAPASGQTLDVMDLFGVLPFKNRLMFLEKDSATLWYGAIAAIQGPLNPFHLDRVHPRAGNCVALGSLTIDSGIGVDDLLVIFMDSGAALVYSGVNIADVDQWGLVGIFELGRVVGARPLVKIGGDLVAITTDGYIPLQGFLQRGRVAKALALSDKIAPSASEAVRFYSGDFGWQAVLYTPANWLLFNLPDGTQHVMNSQTGAWCRFTGMDAKCWAVWKDRIYFGGAGGKVFRADVGADDAGALIPGEAATAYNYLKSPMDKQFKMVRALIESEGAVQYGLEANVDFIENPVVQVSGSIATLGTKWGTAKWGTFKWGGGVVRDRQWRTVDKQGTAISLRLVSNTRNARPALYASDIMAEKSMGITN